MEKKKYDLCIEVLRRMREEGILENLILVGSWCVMLYQEYFQGKAALPAIRTRDLEFLIRIPPKFRKKADLPQLLKDLGFIVDYRGEKGYTILMHPDLIIEFLVPARGKDSDKPCLIEEIGIRAQALRFLDLLARSPIQLFFGDTKVCIPHPANFALQKLLIADRRKNKDKAKKDRSQAIAILNSLEAAGQFEIVRGLYISIPKSWRIRIKRELQGLGEHGLLRLIEPSELDRIG